MRGPPKKGTSTKADRHQIILILLTAALVILPLVLGGLALLEHL